MPTLSSQPRLEIKKEKHGGKIAAITKSTGQTMEPELGRDRDDHRGKPKGASPSSKQ
jgi:hypothetical protein